MNEAFLFLKTNPTEFAQLAIDDVVGENSYFQPDDLASVGGGVVEVKGQQFAVKKVFSEGGGEGEGEHVEVIFEFKLGKDVAYLRTTGFYESYNGTEWSGVWTEVEPREVVVTQYFPV
jgi:hypothetical protein